MVSNPKFTINFQVLTADYALLVIYVDLYLIVNCRLVMMLNEYIMVIWGELSLERLELNS